MIKYFVRVDAAGIPAAFYPSDGWPTPPVGTVEITANQYKTWLADQRKGQRNQLIGADGKIVAKYPA